MRLDIWIESKPIHLNELGGDPNLSSLNVGLIF